ncbi:hypothetical protein NF865_09255 [Thermococcus aggregans]|uniref:Uncharacterized protein n=1 Tax=Thermococcus aggregans TaxID=110163 RepID=A0A9E7MX79_THEAG|nr:hypothetical protein [Thermococcus aggregans]USS40475.1 hypothetical protein NF865_09255 [Thermococcus aggregans]
MMRLFKVKSKVSRKVQELGEGTSYVSLLVLAKDEKEAENLVEKYFQEEGAKKENFEILKIEEIKPKEGEVLGVIVG